MLRHAVDAAKVAAVGDRRPRKYVMARRNGSTNCGGLRLSAVKLNGRCVVHQHHGLYAYVRSPLRHQYREVWPILAMSSRNSLPPMAACYRASPSNSVIQPGYWRTGGALVGQGDAGCAGAAVIGAGSSRCGRFLCRRFLGSWLFGGPGLLRGWRQLYDDRIGSKTGGLTCCLKSFRAFQIQVRSR